MHAHGSNERRARGIRAVLFGVAANALLIVLKGTAGALGHSSGLVADAVHSAADLVNSLLALASLLVSRKPPDAAHPYGHGRAEALSANFAAMVIGAAGLLVGWESIGSLARGRQGAPDLLTLWVALFATAAKLVLAIYAGRVARATRSKAVNADARDHLADVLSGAVVIAGIAAARAGWSLLDPLAGLIVSGFILYTAFQVFLGAATELMDTSLTPSVRAAVIAESARVAGVQLTGIAGRMIGSETLVELHAEVDPNLTVSQAGALVDALKARLVARIPEVEHVVVELNSSAEEPEALQVVAPPH